MPPPRQPRWKSSTVLLAALLAIAVLTVALAGVVVGEGYGADRGGPFTISGSVVVELGGGRTQPLTGAQVVVSGEGGFSVTTASGIRGTFVVNGVPPGGVNITVISGTYRPATLTTFVSSVYDAGSTGLTIDVGNSTQTTGNAYVLSPFASMEGFLASVGSAAALLLLVGILAAVGALSSSRPGGGVVAALGGGAGACAPAVLYLLYLAGPFPWITLGAAIAGGWGAFVLAVAASTLSRGDAATAAP